MNKHRIFEIICVVLLICFIFFISREEPYSDKSVRDIVDAVSAEINVEELKSYNKNKIQEEFDIEFQDIDSYAYYASDSVMNVEELLVIKLKEGAKADNITEKIEQRVKDKQVLFEGYAPTQSAMLKNYVLIYQKGFIFYAVCDEWADTLTLVTSYI